MNKREYVSPMVDMATVELEEGIAAASVAPHEAEGTVTEVWEEEEIIFDKVEW